MKGKPIVGEISGAFERFGGNNNYKYCGIVWLMLSTIDVFKRENVVQIC